MIGAMTKIGTNQRVHTCTELPSGVHHWYLEPGSQLYLLHEQRTSDEINTQITFVLGAGSSLTYMPIITHSGHITITFQLAEYSSAQVNGAYVLNAKQKISLITRQEHSGKNSSSSLCINGVATGAAVVEYTGMIAIQEHAIRSQAHQENKTLLLSSQASAVSIPSLEVLTNDVQCGHGSAVGPLQKEHLIYAQSRGISLLQAKHLLITSYFAQTLHGILDKAVRQEIIKRLVDKALGE